MKSIVYATLAALMLGLTLSASARDVVLPADSRGRGGEIRFIESALQKSAGGQDDVPRTGA
jgi:hypothetical protein